MIYHAFSHKEAKDHDVQVQSVRGDGKGGSGSSKAGVTVFSHGLRLSFPFCVLGPIKTFCADVFMSQTPSLGYQSQL